MTDGQGESKKREHEKKSIARGSINGTKTHLNPASENLLRCELLSHHSHCQPEKRPQIN